jgi:HEAT repeat protein
VRRQDELLAIYPGRDRFTRKFILSQVEGLALAFDSDELLRFLHGERADDDPLIRHQAIHTLVRFLPAYMRRRYGLSGQLAGVWTGFAQKADAVKKFIADAKDEPKRAEQRRRAGLFLARPLADALLEVSRGAAGRTSIDARLALVRFPLKCVHRELAAILGASDTAPFDAVVAVALTAAGETAERDVLATLDARGARQPDLLMLVPPTPRGFDALMDFAGRTDQEGRINLALALARMRGVDHAEAVRRLSGFHEGWVTVCGARALEASGEPRHVQLLTTIYQAGDNPFIKSQAVRAASGIPCPESLDFCLAALHSRTESVRAQALEGLVRLKCPADVLAREAAPFLSSGRGLRSRVNALLATARVDPAALPAELTELLMSTDNLDRLEAAYCLGYLQTPRGLGCLSTLITMDPSASVRQQAIKSLSKYPARMAVPALLPALSSPEPRVALTAALVLARFDDDEAVLTCQHLLSALGAAQNPVEKKLMYRALGALAGKVGYADVREPLVKGLSGSDPAVVRGALEGWIVFGGPAVFEADSRVREILRSGEPRVRPRCALALFTRGHADALEHLGRMLRSGDEAVVSGALDAAAEIGLLLATPEAAERFPDMTARLQETAATPECTEFAASDEVTLRDVPSPLADAPAAPGSPAAVPPPAAIQDTEGEFAVRRSLRRSSRVDLPPASRAARRRASALPAPAELAQLPEVKDLARHLGRPQVAAQAQLARLVARLKETTYLVGDRLADPDWRALAWKYRALAVPVAALLTVMFVISAAAWSRMAPPEPAPLAPLSVGALAGHVTAGPRSTPLVRGQRIEAGTEIAVGPQSSVRLVTRSLGSVTVRSGSRLVVERISGEPQNLSVSVERGHYVFDQRRGGRIEVQFGRFRLSADRSVFSIEEDQGKPTLIVDAGRVTVAEGGAGAATTDVDVGDARVLE